MADFISRILDWIEKKTDRTRPAEKIKTYVVDRYYFLDYQFTHGRDAEKEDTVRDLYHLHEKMISLGWIKAPQNPFKVAIISDPIPLDELIRWRKTLQDDRVIRSGIVKVGTGRYLDQFACLERKDQLEFVNQNLERLLRHVETQRGKSLRWFDRRLKEENRWWERLDIVLLFIRTSERRKDLRYLNAALKCTDDYFNYFQYKLPGPLLVRYLIALVEQETVFKGLTEK